MIKQCEPNTCPKCGSTDTVENDHYDVHDHGDIAFEVSSRDCRNCGAIFNEYYDENGYIESYSRADD